MSLVINGSGSITGLAVGGLPDGTVDAGTLATDSVVAAKLGTDAVTADALKSDAITGADLPAGSVLQVVNTSTTAQQSTTSTSWVDTNLSLSITPSATTSKIQIQYSFQNVYLTVAGAGCSFRILRDTTSLFTPAGGFAMWNGTGIGYWQYGDIALDSPSTTSSVTYKIQVSNYDSKAVHISGSGKYKNTITLMEIAG